MERRDCMDVALFQRGGMEQPGALRFCLDQGQTVAISRRTRVERASDATSAASRIARCDTADRTSDTKPDFLKIYSAWQSDRPRFRSCPALRSLRSVADLAISVDSRKPSNARGRRRICHADPEHKRV